MAETVFHSDHIGQDLERYVRQGYRLDMITPADSPREAQLSKNNEVVRLILDRKNAPSIVSSDPKDGWIAGRAGMMYRDLLPDRLDGKLIASHIRLTEAGPVPDYVHYHKIEFQLIYCLKGRIRVVYEDQGVPFWVEPGDCVLQPPEIRHRVLEAEAGSEVLELSSPAEHETWVEHELRLPTAEINPYRLFGGQQFVRSVAKDAVWYPSETEGVEVRDLGIYEATKGLVDVRIRRACNADLMTAFSPRPGMTGLGFVISGKVKGSINIDSTDIPPITEILRLEFQNG